MHRFASVMKEGQDAAAFIDIPHTALALLIVGMCNWATEWLRPRHPRGYRGDRRRGGAAGRARCARVGSR